MKNKLISTLFCATLLLSGSAKLGAAQNNNNNDEFEKIKAAVSGPKTCWKSPLLSRFAQETLGDRAVPDISYKVRRRPGWYPNASVHQYKREIEVDDNYASTGFSQASLEDDLQTYYKSQSNQHDPELQKRLNKYKAVLFHENEHIRQQHREKVVLCGFTAGLGTFKALSSSKLVGAATIDAASFATIAAASVGVERLTMRLVQQQHEYEADEAISDEPEIIRAFIFDLQQDLEICDSQLKKYLNDKELTASIGAASWGLCSIIPNRTIRDCCYALGAAATLETMRKDSLLDKAFSSHPPTEKRIERLQQRLDKLEKEKK